MEKKLVLILSALTILMSLTSCTKTNTAPNVLLIITDDQGYGDMSCHGNPWLKTPNLDDLYNESTRFTDFHVGPTCSPTRAALLSGQHTNRTGCWHTVGGRSLLREGTTTIADVLKENGYATGIFGKWHMGDNYPFRPQDRGFDEVLVHGGGGVGQQPDYWNNNYYDDTYFRNGKPEKHNGYCTDVWFREAKKFISRNVETNQPFFCYLSTNAPHGPYYVADTHSAKYKGLEGVVNPYYYGMIDNIDQNLGSLMGVLDSLKIAENTIVMFMTDNGVGNGAGLKLDRYDGFVVEGYNAGMRGCKGSMYEGGHRVPFFIRWPDGGVKSNLDIDQLAGHIDVLPTLLEAIGIPQESVGQKIDGISLWKIITGKSDKTSKRILITDSQRIEYPEKWRRSSTMKGKWRLINGEELYDLETDPEQRNNIAEENPKILNELRNEYEKWWSDLEPSFDHYPAISLGSDAEPVTIINTMDMHVDSGYSEVPWHQWHIRKPRFVRGWYAVNFEETGMYRFTLYRWPPESGNTLNESIPEFPAVPNTNIEAYDAGESIQINKARLVIDENEFVVLSDEKNTRTELTAEVDKGRHTLRAEFVDGNKIEFAAFYIKIEKLK